jgi:hypothetical protein
MRKRREKREKMNKAKLIKKDSPLQQEMRTASKTKKVRARKVQARTAIEVTREWLHQKREESPSAREAFASLFGESDPQSA